MGQSALKIALVQGNLSKAQSPVKGGHLVVSDEDPGSSPVLKLVVLYENMPKACARAAIPA